MSKAILVAVALGLAAGYFIVPDSLVPAMEIVINVGLCLLLFLIGLDMGRQGSILKDIKAVGFGVLAIPVAVLLGSLFGGVLAALVLPLSVQDTLAVSAGMGWYTLAPAIILDYSVEVSAVSFLHNVMRELSALVLIPVVAAKYSYVETVAMPGAAAMDVCMPIVEKATTPAVAVYSFVTGVFLSIMVPILVPLIISF